MWKAVMMAVTAGALKPAPLSRIPSLKRGDHHAVGPRGAAAGIVTTLALAPLPALAEAPGWVGPVSTVLQPTLFVIQFAMLCRILLSWYPEINLNKPPFNLVAWPTEPILRATRSVVPPAFGVDISPVVWIGIASLLQELLLGQQGVLVLLAK
ncbi:hypothetical protein CTAYLR_001183 [Chrysophaeum taylorii]|uniref:YggT family protein n=1 Tax=Chrysophaeum taylorii TaxID=2483200 RepID=A0AAD7UQQ9_9STRA|nr:hypothetical protein CTAYLR_001183 [Chrysophaeum taylorii]